MKTLQEIREDLAEIKFYYANEKEIIAAGKVTGLIRLAETVKAYNEAVSNAKGQLYIHSLRFDIANFSGTFSISGYRISSYSFSK